MARGKMNVDVAMGKAECAEDAASFERPRERCWRCAKKAGAPRRPGRPSHAHRKICRHCVTWLRLNAADQRALGRIAFIPASKRPKADNASEAGKARQNASPRTQSCTSKRAARKSPRKDRKGAHAQKAPADDLYGAPDPEADPLRDYTYWLQHERAKKKGTL